MLSRVLFAVCLLTSLLPAEPVVAQGLAPEEVPVLTSPLVLIGDVNPEWPVDDIPTKVRLVPFELNDAQRQAVMAAPRVALNKEPSDVLRNALERNWLREIRADRATGEGVDALQGYLYYLAAPGQYLEVLCVSVPTFPVIWSHCQEEGIGRLESF